MTLLYNDDNEDYDQGGDNDDGDDDQDDEDDDTFLNCRCSLLYENMRAVL